MFRQGQTPKFTKELRADHPRFRFSSLFAALLALGFMSSPAHAYLGPGSGLTALGSVAALIGVVGLGIVGFLWYPIKRAWKKMRGVEDESASAKVEDEA